MDVPITNFIHAGSLEELKAKGRLVVRGPHRPILIVHDRGRVFALDNRCPHGRDRGTPPIFARNTYGTTSIGPIFAS